MISEDNYWVKEIQLYKAHRNKRNPFGHYYPEKMASLLVLRDYFSTLVNLRKARILEAGMGSGMALVLAVKKGAICSGVDISREACKFGRILKEDYLDRTQRENFKIVNKDILKYNTTKKFDLVFNIGSLEHQNQREQLKYLQRMKDLSKKYVLVGVPDYRSPIFRSFIWYFSRQNRVYEEKHLPINVEGLFKRANISFIDKVGMGIGISYKHINKNDPMLVSFLKRKFRIRELKQLNISAQKINWLIEIEKSLSKKDADNFGFIDLFVGKTEPA